MRTTIATINLYLRTAKQFADGTYAIYLRCNFSGMYEIPTHYSIPAKYWDKKNQVVKKGCPNYATINIEIQKLKNKAIKRRDDFIKNECPYTPKMVLQDLQVDLTGNSNKCVDLIARYLNENSPKRSTQNNWNHMKNLLVEYSSKEVIVNELNVKFVKGFADFMLNKGIGESTCNTLLGKVSCLMNYSVGLGLVSKNPFKEWKYYKVYKRKDSTLYIHPKSIEVMKELFLNECCVFNGRMWHYKNEDTIIEQLIDRRTTLFAKYLYLCGVLFNGLAPIDLCQIKAKELQIKTIKGNEYYAWDGKRQKTNVDVKVRIKKDMYSNFMIQTMLMFRNGEYLLPVLDGAENYNSDQKVNRVKKTLNDLTPALREWFEEVNQEIINKNVENKTDIPLIDLKCSYYSYRHSYAMQYLIKGGNILKLATRLGRSVNTISAYVQHLKEETDLIDDEEE
jgi:hypothetical protein